MELSDEAIILATRAYGESSAIVDVFCAEYGVYAGMVKGANSKSKRGVFQAGNIVHATWRARLSEQLGTLICELETPIAALILSDRLSLTVLNTATELIKRLIPERHPEPMLYARLKTLLMDMRDQDNPNMLLRDYIRFELELLRDLGFGLDLTRCAGSGTTENLIYVSPKSACAVSAEAGEPYKDKLLPLPPFLLDANHTPTEHEITDGLSLTGFFLEKEALAHHHPPLKMPDSRKRLEKLMAIG